MPSKSLEDLQRKLEILADAAKYDASCASGGSTRTNTGGLGNTNGMGICHSFTPDGRCVSLLKILLTNFCIFDCVYCVNRISSDVRRAAFTPDEVVWLTLEFYRRNYIEGLFLSSGVINSPDHTMELLCEVGRQLRDGHGFGGYIHLKAVPGASPELLRKAALYADRLSANIELPTQGDLDRLAPAKTISSAEEAMSHIRQAKEEAEELPASASPVLAAGQSTQMIVGATPTSDADILQTASRLYDRHGLRRVYYTAFSPIPQSDSRLPLKPPALVREHRLYEADWLIRHYGFRASELFEEGDGNLDPEISPKLAWALRHRDFFPVDVNRASRSQLLRVPGLGARNVDRILAMRRQGSLRLEDLARLRVRLSEARYFITTADPPVHVLQLDRADLRRAFVPAGRQLGLFDDVPPACAAKG